jgi:hypothetical protein
MYHTLIYYRSAISFRVEKRSIPQGHGGEVWPLAHASEGSPGHLDCTILRTHYCCTTRLPRYILRRCQQKLVQQLYVTFLVVMPQWLVDQLLLICEGLGARRDPQNGGWVLVRASRVASPIQGTLG